MGDDITSLLQEWPYDLEDELQVRLVRGPDGEPRMQVRLELGLLEMHTAGRPDGRRVDGCDSLRAYYEQRAAHEQQDDGEDTFRLDHEECGELQREALQYYHRRIGWLRLGRHHEAATDAEHNLAIMDLLKTHAANQMDWLSSEQYRAFVLTHLTRARMLGRLEEGDVSGALQAVDEGIATIEKLFREEYERADLIGDSEELKLLRRMKRSLLDTDRGDGDEQSMARLHRELQSAIKNEDFELAAMLRDMLENLHEGG